MRMAYLDRMRISDCGLSSSFGGDSEKEFDEIMIRILIISARLLITHSLQSLWLVRNEGK